MYKIIHWFLFFAIHFFLKRWRPSLCSFYGWKKIFPSLGQWSSGGWTWVIGYHTGTWIHSICDPFVLVKFDFNLLNKLMYLHIIRATGDDTRSLCTTVCKWTYLGHAHMQLNNERYGSLWMGWWFLGGRLDWVIL